MKPERGAIITLHALSTRGAEQVRVLTKELMNHGG